MRHRKTGLLLASFTILSGCTLMDVSDLGQKCTGVSEIVLSGGNRCGTDVLLACNNNDCTSSETICSNYRAQGVFVGQRCPNEYTCSHYTSEESNEMTVCIRNCDDRNMFWCGTDSCVADCELCPKSKICYKHDITCEDDQKRCIRNKVQVCSGNTWTTITECENRCLDGICTDEVPECSQNNPCPDGKVCSDDGKCVPANDHTPECSNDDDCVGNTYCVDNKCVSDTPMDKCSTNEDCTDEKVCLNGACIDTSGCNPGDILCTPDKKGFVKCGDDGQWILNTIACEAGKTCENNKCQSNEPVCTNSDSKCMNDTTLNVCKEGKWIQMPCNSDETCENGQCIKCHDGEKMCTGRDRVAICQNGSW